MSNQETASLVILVDSTGAATATKQLDDMAAAGARAETAVNGLGSSARDAGEAASKAAQAQKSDLNLLYDALTGNTKSAAALAEQQGALNRLQLTGAQSSASLAEATVMLEVASEKLGITQAAATEATNTDTVATVRNTEAKMVNGGVARELGVMIGELARGNYTRLEGSTITLANRTGLMAKMFSLTGLAIAGVAASIGLVIAAYIKGSSEANAYNNALLMTGNYAGFSAGQLQDMARAMGATTGTQHAFADALARVTESGRFTGAAVLEVSRAAVALSEKTGESVDKTIAVFQRLAEDPVKDIVKLNDQYHFLTESVYAQIEALQKQGDAQGAAQLAIQTYSSTVIERTDQMDQHLGTLQKSLHGLKGAWNAFWDAALNIGRPNTNQETFDKMSAAHEQNQIDIARGGPEGYGQSDAYVAEVKKRDAALVASMAAMQDARMQSDKDANKQKMSQDANDAAIQLDEEAQKYATRQEKRATEIAKIHKQANEGIEKALAVDDKALADKIRESEAKAVAGVEEKYKQKKTKKDPEVSAFSTFQSQVDAMENKVIGPDDDPALKKYEQEIAKLADDLNHYMEKNGDATKASEQFVRGQKAAQERLEEGRKAQKEADDAFDLGYAKKSLALQRSVDDQVNAIGMGTKEAARTREVTKAYQDQADALNELGLKRQYGKLTQEQYDHDVQTVKDATDKNVAAMQNGFKRIDAAQGSWLKGAKTAMQDYADAGQNVAGLTQGFFTSSFDNMTNALTNFATTGKLSFQGLVASILTDLAKMEMRIAASKILTSIIGGMSGGDGAYTGVGGASSGFNALGNAYDSGGMVTAYASGGVVDSPTMFSHAGGLGIMGEAGPEAVMPLTRGADGKLGVQSSGGGSDISVTTIVNVQSNGQTGSSSSSDGANAMGKQAADMIKGVVTETVTRMTQPGGLLWKQRVSGA